MPPTKWTVMDLDKSGNSDDDSSNDEIEFEVGEEEEVLVNAQEEQADDEEEGSEEENSEEENSEEGEGSKGPGKKKNRAAERIRQLNKQFREEQKKAKQLEQDIAELKTKQLGAKKQQILAEKNSLENSLPSLKAAVIAAKKDDDHEAEIQAQSKLNEAETKLLAINSSYNEDDYKEVEKPKTASNTVDDTPPEAQDWLLDNPEFFSNEGFKQATIIYSNKLMREGLEVTDPEFYEKLDAYLVSKKLKVAEGGEEEAKPVKKTGVKSPMAGGRQGGGAKGGNRKVKLSQQEVDLAKRMGLSPERYAKEKIKYEARDGSYTQLFDK